MKHFNTIALSVLCIAVVILYILHFSSQGKTPCETVLQKNNPAKISLSDSFPIAYVNVDTLLMNYLFAKEMNEELLKKQERFHSNISRRQQELQQDAIAFQRKYESGGFTKETFEQEQARLMKKEQELQDMDRRLTQELYMEQQKMNSRLRDTINNFFKHYNQDKHYKIILSDTQGDNILYAKDNLNITSDVLEQLNARYRPSGK